jgi:hypothetical protein
MLMSSLFSVASLFPLFLGLVPTDSPNLGALLDLMRDENQLCTYNFKRVFEHVILTP